MNKKNILIIVIILIILSVGFKLYKTFFQNEFKPITAYKESKMEKVIPLSNIDMNALYQNEYNMRAYSKGTSKSMSGIDVSVHQGQIDWEKVKSAGVEFVMIRIGYRDHNTGKIIMDKRFKENIQGALNQNIKVGIYFFSQAINIEEALQEANFVLENIYGQNIEMPIAFDMESVSNTDRINNLSIEDKTKIADCFLSAIKQAGYIPMIYGNPDWMSNSFNLNKLSNYNIWLAHYNSVTDYPYQFAMWQYTDKGKISGIQGNTDLDIFFYSEMKNN